MNSTGNKGILISEKLRDEIVDVIVRNIPGDMGSDPGAVSVVSALRTAPSVEMLDLSKVERFDCRQDDGMVNTNTGEGPGEGEWVRFSDLQNLIKPEQSGGVVSRIEPVQVGFFERVTDDEQGYELRHFHEGMNDVPDRWVAAYADKKYWSDFLKEKPYTAPPMQASEARGGDLDGLVSGELARYITNDEDLFHATQSVIAHLQQVPQGIGCGEYKIPGFDGTMWKCGGKPSSANGKMILCDDCFSTIEKWGTQLSWMSVPTVEELKKIMLKHSSFGSVTEAGLKDIQDLFTQPPKDKP